jgi:hypothetical protein
MIANWNWKDRARAATIHLGISLAVALMAAGLVFGQWYPYPYRAISGGSSLFLILVTVDVIMGPLITLMIFNRAKPMRELRRDLAVVAVLQLAALAYGVWVVWIARPVHVVFEVDRLRVVHAADVPVDLLDRTPPGIDPLPLSGPTLLAVRPFRSEDEKREATLVALQGISLSARPDLWQAYEAARPRVREAAHPVALLKQRFPERSAEIDAVLASHGARPAPGWLYLPMVGRTHAWTAFLDPATAEPVAYLPLDSF